MWIGEDLPQTNGLEKANHGIQLPILQQKKLPAQFPSVQLSWLAMLPLSHVWLGNPRSLGILFQLPSGRNAQEPKLYRLLDSFACHKKCLGL